MNERVEKYIMYAFLGAMSVSALIGAASIVEQMIKSYNSPFINYYELPEGCTWIPIERDGDESIATPSKGAGR